MECNRIIMNNLIFMKKWRVKDFFQFWPQIWISKPKKMTAGANFFRSDHFHIVNNLIICWLLMIIQSIHDYSWLLQDYNKIITRLLQDYSWLLQDYRWVFMIITRLFITSHDYSDSPTILHIPMSKDRCPSIFWHDLNILRQKWGL